MPSKSKKQRGKMAILHKRGEITDEQWEKFKKIKRGGNSGRIKRGSKRGKR